MFRTFLQRERPWVQRPCLRRSRLRSTQVVRRFSHRSVVAKSAVQGFQPSCSSGALPVPEKRSGTCFLKYPQGNLMTFQGIYRMSMSGDPVRICQDLPISSSFPLIAFLKMIRMTYSSSSAFTSLMLARWSTIVERLSGQILFSKLVASAQQS